MWRKCVSDQTRFFLFALSVPAAALQVVTGRLFTKVVDILEYLGKKWSVLLLTSEKRSKNEVKHIPATLSVSLLYETLRRTCAHIARTGSHACDVRLEFGVESEVDEGSRDLHPPPDNSHKYD